MRYSPGPVFGLMLTWVFAAAAQATPRFPPGAVWNQDISQASPHPQSGTMIS